MLRGSGRLVKRLRSGWQTQTGEHGCTATKFPVTTGYELNHSPGQRGGHGGVARNNKLFLNAAWYVAKTGIAWRDLPERFGKWDTVYHRYNEWYKKGVWQRIFDAVQDPDLECRAIH